ncbi:MAG: hypothetical protein II920_10985 [Clostridia bacterium]|nr:hypothetical protein [Clostridia bacterium]
MKAKRRTKGGLTAFLLVTVLLTGLFLYGVINARTVRVVYGEVKLKNLDYRLDGVKILYLSDLNISSASEAEHAARLVERLSALKPDIILIGGDITDTDLLCTVRQLLGISTSQQESDNLLSARDLFLRRIDELHVPGGILAVTGESDLPLTDMEKSRHNVFFLEDSGVNVTLNGAVLPVYGGRSAAFNLSGSGVSPMIIMFHDPRLYGSAALRASERNSEPGSYLMLSGHLLEGQIRIGGLHLYEDALCEQFPTDKNGVYSDGSGMKMLIGSGIGAKTLPVRIGTAPKAYLITLRASRT